MPQMINASYRCIEQIIYASTQRCVRVSHCFRFLLLWNKNRLNTYNAIRLRNWLFVCLRFFLAGFAFHSTPLAKIRYISKTDHCGVDDSFERVCLSWNTQAMLSIVFDSSVSFISIIWFCILIYFIVRMKRCAELVRFHFYVHCIQNIQKNTMNPKRCVCVEMKRGLWFTHTQQFNTQILTFMYGIRNENEMRISIKSIYGKKTTKINK